MKLSRQQIQQIVKENILDWFSMPKMIPDEERYEMLLDKAHEHELDRDIARAEPLALAGDFEAAIHELMQGITAVNESRKMKITKQQLRRIIKEEKASLLREAGPGRSVGDYPRDSRGWIEMLGQLIDQDMSERGVWYEDEGRDIAMALEALRREITDKLRGDSR